MEANIFTGISHKHRMSEAIIYSDISQTDRIGYCALVQMKGKLFCKTGILPWVAQAYTAELAAYVVGIQMVPQEYAITLYYDINDLPDLVFNPGVVPYAHTCQPYLAQLQQLIMQRPIILERVPRKEFHYHFCHSAARLQSHLEKPIEIEVIK